MIWRRGGRELPTAFLEEIRLPGLHNQENVLAAVAACFLAGAPLSAVREVVTQFTGVEHRIEPVRVLDGVKWYNDSKATSPAEAVAALTTLAGAHRAHRRRVGQGHPLRSHRARWWPRR